MILDPTTARRYSKLLVCAVDYTGLIEFDFTPYIVVPSYNVTSKAEWYEWEDMRHVVHRKIKRYTVSGTFSLLIDDPDILQLIARYYPPTLESIPLFVMPNNIIASGPDDCYDYVYEMEFGPFNDFAFSYNLKNDFPYYGFKKHDPIEVTISNKIKQSTEWTITPSPGDPEDDELLERPSLDPDTPIIIPVDGK